MAQGFYIDNKGCYGCMTCSMACITTRIPGNRATYMRRVADILLDERQAYSFLSMSCNHCEEPACLANCPVGAYEKLDNGIVKQDHQLCIGCQTCVRACPYAAPVYDEEEGKTYKCDMCYELQEQGELPACVQACPGANLAVGDMDDLKKSRTYDYVSDADVETKPNFVIAADQKLDVNPGKYGLTT